MNTKRIIIFAGCALLLIIFYVFNVKENKKVVEREFVTITASSSIPAMTIDEKISKAELIIAGNVVSRLPSESSLLNANELKDATPEDIFKAKGLFTDSLISIEQVFKGTYKKPVIRVRSFIGETKYVGWADKSEPKYTPGKTFLLFLIKDTGPTQVANPGDYISVDSNASVYEIIDNKAISADDEWVLEDLVAYVQKSLNNEDSSLTDVPTETPISTETISPAP